MDKPNKKLRKELRSLAAMAYEAEMEEALSSLEDAFKAWRNKRMDAFELNEKIHRYHQGPAREIYNRYSVQSMTDLMVAQAVASGLIAEDALSEEMKSFLAPKIAIYKQL